VRLALPTDTVSPVMAILVPSAGMVTVAIRVCVIESSMARLRLSRIPVLVGGALVLSTVAIAVHFVTGGAR
jgi:hypothetical protein